MVEEVQRAQERSKSIEVYFAQRGVQRKYVRRYKGKCGIFFGIEHRLRKEEVKEQCKSKGGWRFAADAARFADERASGEDR